MYRAYAVPLDEILPGRCGLKASSIRFHVRHRGTKARSMEGPSFYIGGQAVAVRNFDCSLAKPSVAWRGVDQIVVCREGSAEPASRVSVEIGTRMEVRFRFL